ncbi:unnamed protein product [Caenorhabditis bovis]|uniref:DNA repair and recombination protein RAD54-like n=1 Tax=Caenorhabditis bovis TaxID=2654633 RepID=A0A8S1F5P0_9PELO|nr:unnamed protein product [Caenorhabditis bovis]
MNRIPLSVDPFDGKGCAENEIGRFVVLYGKTSTRKHKIWEGDGILICYNDSSILKSDNEKDVICRSSAIKKIDELEDGRVIVLGSWSVQIQEKIQPISGSTTAPEFVNVRTLQEVRKRPLSNPVFSGPAKRGFVSPLLNSNGEIEKVPLFVLNEEEVLQRKCGAICVDPRFVKCLRDHQKQGIRFLFDKLRREVGGGAILADDMGLGKSVQTMAATWALMKGAKNGKNLASKCLIVVPSSLVNNWKAEFNKWWRNMLFPALVLQKASDIDRFISTSRNHPYMVISYDMALRYTRKLKDIHFDIIVCDEGHKLKNKDGKMRKSLASLGIPKRLILTGTPMQNDYDEFFSLLDFVRPEQFGTLPEFLKMCSDEPTRLNQMIDDCMLRRSAEINNSHLPEKHEYILFCEASDVQRQVHEAIRENMTGDALSLIYYARQLANHPKLMFDSLTEKHAQGNTRNSSLLLAFPDRYVPKGGVGESGKLVALLDMLKCFRILNECAVIVSNYIETLDMIEQLCEYLEFRIFRLDGKTNVSDRQKLVKKFNDVHNSENVFLLSTKAGGVGLNLTGASRLVLFDSDWNPANDQQAMARIWRDGQVRPCHIYRLITTGTIEEKMLQRQIKKTGLGCVIDAIEIGDCVSKFTEDELADIFSFADDTECNTHDLCQCKCDGTGILEAELAESDDDMESVDDEQLEDEEDEEVVEQPPNAEVVSEAVKDEAGRASLAELSRWRHFSPRHEDTWKHFMTNAGLSQVDTDVHLTFAFYQSSQY